MAKFGIRNGLKFEPLSRKLLNGMHSNSVDPLKWQRRAKFILGIVIRNISHVFTLLEYETKEIYFATTGSCCKK